MGSLRATLRAATLANRFLGYIVTVILTGYAKADLGKRNYKKLLSVNNALVGLCVK